MALYDIPATRDDAVKFEIFVECNGIRIVAVALACSTYSTGTILLTSNSLLYMLTSLQHLMKVVLLRFVHRVAIIGWQH